MKYTFYNETENIETEMSIIEIIDCIRKTPENAYYKVISGERILINNSIILNTTFICHRINDLKELANIPREFGVEIDIRDGLRVIHDPDPSTTAPTLDEYLKHYNHKLIIFNVKCERMEMECLKLIEKYGVKNYFFLDTNLPMMYLLNQGDVEPHIAGRFSEFEPIEYFEKIKGMISWVWVDCFSQFPLTLNYYETFKKTHHRICIVSPELQGRKGDIGEYRNEIIKGGMIPDAICCKYENIIEWI
jgi:hypothetical protein